ncbi:hypothetical protein [Actinoplanes sp. NPDC026670]|uniref:hypothetical protein n=1 Tax=Actinoplanes sp. NPDC026670 TaxID=3154700 RepID=UPI0033D3C21E
MSWTDFPGTVLAGQGLVEATSPFRQFLVFSALRFRLRRPAVCSARGPTQSRECGCKTVGGPRMRKSQARSRIRPFAAGATAAVATAAALAASGLPAAAAANLVLNTSQVAAAGGTVLYVSGWSGTADGYGVRFVTSTGTCPTDYDDSGTGVVEVAGALEDLSASVSWILTPALTAGTTYKPCFYQGTGANAAAATDTLASSGTTTVTAVNFGVPSATTGQAAEKVTLTSPSAAWSASTYASQFVSGVTACPNTYTAASSSVLVAATVKTSTSVLTITVPTVVVGTSYLICTYAGTTAGTSALNGRGTTSFTAFDKTLPAVTVKPNAGSSSQENTVTVSAPTGSTAFTGTPDAIVSRNSCPNTRPLAANLGNTTFLEPYEAVLTKISNAKVAVTIPADVVLVNGGDVATPWNICIYASSTAASALVSAPGIYNVAANLEVSGAQFAVGSGAAGNTAAGPAQGGSAITVSGLEGIPTATGALITASLGGSAIENIVVKSTSTFTGTTTSHAAGAVDLKVTTAAGSDSTANQPYTYNYGITVTPNTAANTANPVLDITGAGFDALSFENVAASAVPTAGKSLVLLTDNTWNAQSFTNLTAYAVKPISYCNTVLPISDTEIICTLSLTASVASTSGTQLTLGGGAVPAGTYTITIANDADGLDSANYELSVVSSGSTFTVASF